MSRARNPARAVAALCLLAGASGLAAPPETAGARDTGACQAVMEAANHNKLAGLVVPFTDSARVDINNDGWRERVELTSEGTMHVEALKVFDRRGKPIELAHAEQDDWENDNVRWAMDQRLIRFRAQIYILGKTDDELHYLSRVDSRNVERLVCQFAQRKEPVEQLVTSKDSALCQAAQRRELHYVTYDRLHALTHATLQEAGFAETMPGQFAALIDLNNDGELEPVVPLELASGRGRGCGATHLGVLTSARNRLNPEMTGLLPEPGCDGTVQTPFSYGGKTYIEKLGAANNVHEIVQLRHDKLDTVCAFDVRKVNYLLGEYERILENAEAAHVDPWVYALNMRGTAGLRALLEAKRDLRIQVRADLFGTVVHEAIRRKKFRDLEFLLANGADPNITASDDPNDPLNQPPLIFAIWASSVDATRLLLQHGASADQPWLGKPARDWAELWVHSGKNRAAILEMLAAKQASPDTAEQPATAHLTAAGD